MRILVCGGRTYGFDDPLKSSNTVRKEILKAVYLLTKKGLPLEVTIIHGGATGADTLAGVAAEWFNWKCEVYPADWKTHGKKAGILRNIQMLEESKPDLVIAFPGGRGTAHMVKIAREAGVEVIEVKC